MRWLLLFVMSFALSACGGTTSTDVKIGRPARDVYAALSQSSLGELGELLPELAMHRTIPGEMEILYTVPKTADGEEASIRFMLETLDGGNATMVRTEIDVPSVKARVKGETKVLSALKVSNEIRKLLVHFGDMGDVGAAQRDLSTLLGGIALSTNAKLTQKALDGTLAAESVESMIQGFADAAENGEMLASEDSDWGGSATEEPAVEELTEEEAGYGSGKFTGDAEDAATAATSTAEAAARAAAGKEGSDWGT